MIRLLSRTQSRWTGMFCSTTTARTAALIHKWLIGPCSTTVSMMFAVSRGSSQIGLSFTTNARVARVTRPRAGASSCSTARTGRSNRISTRAFSARFGP